MSKYFKKIIGKLKRKMIMTWILMWLNWSVATINATFQLLNIYKYKKKNDKRLALKIKRQDIA